MSSIPINSTPQPVDVIEYGNFNCQRCQELQKLLTMTLPQFDGEICYTFRHFPNLTDPTALLMALASEAAQRQGQYWAMHHALFTYTSPVSLDSLVKLALTVGIDPERFLDDLHDETLKSRIWADMELGRLADVVATPTLFIGTRRLHGKLTQARLAPLIRHYIGRAKTHILSTVNCENGVIRWSGMGYQ